MVHISSWGGGGVAIQNDHRV